MNIVLPRKKKLKVQKNEPDINWWSYDTSLIETDSYSIKIDPNVETNMWLRQFIGIPTLVAPQL